MLEPYRVKVGPNWVDYNHHLNEGAYGVIFSNATDHALEELGLGAAYREREGGTFYTVETHTRFLREVKEGTELEITTQLLGVDEKRLHLWHEMHPPGREAVASQESLLVHVDTATGSARPAAAIAAATEAVSQELPQAAGRGIRRPGR